MSTVTNADYDYSDPSTIWVIAFQFLFTSLAMIPVYYYLREIVVLPSGGTYVLQYLPVVFAILLFIMEIQFNEYYWYDEKFIKKRNSLDAGLKSTSVIITLFYTLFLLIFGYMMRQSGGYEEIGVPNKIDQVMYATIFTLIVMFAISSFVYTQMKDSRTARQ